MQSEARGFLGRRRVWFQNLRFASRFTKDSPSSSLVWNKINGCGLRLFPFRFYRLNFFSELKMNIIKTQFWPLTEGIGTFNDGEYNYPKNIVNDVIFPKKKKKDHVSRIPENYHSYYTLFRLDYFGGSDYMWKFMYFEWCIKKWNEQKSTLCWGWSQC